MHRNGPLPQVGYDDEKKEDEEDIPDAARMKVDDVQEGRS